MSKSNVTAPEANTNPTITVDIALTGKESNMKKLTLEEILGHGSHPTNPLDVRAITDFGNFLGFEHAEYNGPEAYASIYVTGFPIFEESSLVYTISADDVLALIAALLTYGQKENRSEAGLMAAGTIAALALAARPGMNAWDWEWICDAGSKAWEAQQCSHVPAQTEAYYGWDNPEAPTSKWWQAGDIDGFEEPLWQLHAQAEKATEEREEADVAVDRLVSEFQDWDDNDIPF
jgi:hypothetical protein